MNYSSPQSLRLIPLVVFCAMSASLGCGKKAASSDKTGAAGNPGSAAATGSATGSATEPAAAVPRPHAREGVNVVGSYAFTVNQPSGPLTGTVTLKKQGDERYVGKAEIAGKKFGVVAHRDGASLVGVFNEKSAGSWVTQYNIYCDFALEGVTVDQVTSDLGREFLTGGTASLEASFTYKLAKGFDGRFKGNLDISRDGEALRAKSRRNDQYSGKGLGVRYGDVLAMAYMFNGGTTYVFNLLLDEGDAGGFTGMMAAESFAPALATTTSWRKSDAPDTGAASATVAAVANKCIPVPASGHEMEKLLTPKAGPTGGGASGGRVNGDLPDCSNIVSGHYARCGYSTCQVNLDFDSSNCGRCGKSCEIGETCTKGDCVPN